MARKINRAVFQERLRKLIGQVYPSLNQFELASRLPHSTVASWFGPAGRATMPSADHLVVLAKHFGRSVDWLLRGDGPSDQLGAELRDYLARRLAALGFSPEVVDRALPAPGELLATTVSATRWELEGRERKRQVMMLRRAVVEDGETHGLTFEPDDLPAAAVEIRLGLRPLAEDELNPDLYVPAILRTTKTKRRGR